MDIERQVQDLTERVAILEAALLTRASVAPHLAPPPPPGAVPTGAPPPFSSAPPGPPTGPQVSALSANPFEWGIESVLRWAGVALVTLAGIFLVSTAVTRGWIGPELQLLGAALGGAILLGAAVRLADVRRPWALALGCGGSTVLIASALATHEWLDVVGPGPAIALAVLAVLCSVAVALHTRLEGIALVAGVVGMIAPFDTLDTFGDEAILSWVAAFVLGSSAIGLSYRWPGLRLITGWLGAFVLMVYALNEDAYGLLRAMGFVGTAVIGTTLWLAPTVAERLGTSTGSGNWGSFDWTPVDYRLVALVPAWVWLVLAGLISFAEDSDAGIIAVVVAGAFMGVAELTFSRVSRVVSLATLLGSFVLLAVGLAIYFDGPALMVALAGQAATSYFLSRKLDDLPILITSYLAGAASSMLAIVSLSEAIDRDGFITFGQGLATALVVLCWVGAALGVHHHRLQNVTFDVPFVGAWIGVMMWFAAALTGAPQGLMLISAAWTVMACAGLVVGLSQRFRGGEERRTRHIGIDARQTCDRGFGRGRRLLAGGPVLCHRHWAHHARPQGAKPGCSRGSGRRHERWRTNAGVGNDVLSLLMMSWTATDRRLLEGRLRRFR